MEECLHDDLLTRRPLIIASNRGPVAIHQNQNGSLGFQRSAGGLVKALTGIARQVDTTWISCATTRKDATWRQGKVSLSEGGHEIGVKFISPSESAYDRYYNVISNPLLWFLQHSMWDVPHAPVINRDTWEAWENGYVAINRLFAQAIIEQLTVTPNNALVMLQDYHLYLVAGIMRKRIMPRKRPTILHFIHIPWPGPEYWGILPPTMRTAILEGLCAVDLLGFQTRQDSLNFIRTCGLHLPKASVNYKRRRIWYRNHATHVRDFPIGVDVEALRQLAITDEVSAYRSEIQEIVKDRKLLLRIDRTEPSKNIVRGFQAFEEMLDLYPQYCEQITFLTHLVPSRLDVEEYQNYLEVLHAAAGKVNARFGTQDWEPIRILVGENYPRAVAELQLYDVLLVNAIADGMNLVAKEGPIVNQKDGVLILSEQTGARQQLESGALLISPCDIYATAQAIHQALTIPQEQRQEKITRLRWAIERSDITTWLCQQLEALAELNL